VLRYLNDFKERIHSESKRHEELIRRFDIKVGE